MFSSSRKITEMNFFIYFCFAITINTYYSITITNTKYDNMEKETSKIICMVYIEWMARGPLETIRLTCIIRGHLDKLTNVKGGLCWDRRLINLIEWDGFNFCFN
jgi:hypothetical protein